MISKYNHKELCWLDLESPQEEELLHVVEQYNIPLDIKQRIISKEYKDEINMNYDSLYASVSGNIVFVSDNDLVLTIHNNPIEAFNEFSKEMELDLNGEEKINTHRKLFAYLLKNLYIDSQNQLKASQYEIEKLDQKILSIKKKTRKLTIAIILLTIALLISIL